MKFRKGFWIFVLVVVACSTTAGYWIGRNPSIYDSYLDLTENEVLFYSEIPELFTPEIVQELTSTTHLRVRMTNTDPESADLRLMNQKSAMQIGVFAQKDSGWMALFEEISPDFQFQDLKDRQAPPLLWREENGKILVQVLSASLRQPAKAARNLIVARTMLTTDFQKKWLLVHKWSTTLMSLDESNLPEDRKASALRKHHLPKFD